MGTMAHNLDQQGLVSEGDNLKPLVEFIRQYSGLNSKKDIAQVSQLLPSLPANWQPNGDDTAAIPTDNGYQLFAIEGMQPKLVAEQPWFAGWCSIMVNCSDIAAMGGRPTALVNAVWNTNDNAHLTELMRGITDAAKQLNVTMVGGHTSLNSESPYLAVSILGHANALLSSFAVKPGDVLVAAIDLRGQFQGNSLNWNAATTAPEGRLRDDLEILPTIAEKEFAHAAKDISQAGLLGTTVMMLESSNVGAIINLEQIPKPEQVVLKDWLRAFPSFGYLLATCKNKVPDLLQQFHQREISAAVIGEFNSSKKLEVTIDNQSEIFYDLNNEALTGFKDSRN